jgi:hypothetical protein
LLASETPETFVLTIQSPALFCGIVIIGGNGGGGGGDGGDGGEGVDGSKGGCVADVFVTGSGKTQVPKEEA